MGIFSEAELQKHVDDVLSPIPPTHRHAIIGYADSKGTVRLTYVHRFGEHWRGGAGFEKAKATGFGAAGFVKASW